MKNQRNIMLPTRVRKIQYMTFQKDSSERPDSDSETSKREYFPQFMEEEEVQEGRLQEALKNQFFQPYTDRHKRRNAICELSPQERTVILYAITATLSVRLEELALL